MSSLAGVKITYAQITSFTYFLLSQQYYILRAHYSKQVLYNYSSTVLYTVQVLSILGSNKHMHSNLNTPIYTCPILFVQYVLLNIHIVTFVC
jgi:hypothetical protein